MSRIINFPESSDAAAEPRLRANDDASAQSDASGIPPLLQYWQVALRRRLLIAAIVAICLGAGVVITMLQAPLFTARSQIEISRSQKNITNVPGLDAGASSYDLEFYSTQYALLKAGSLAERVARKLKLANDPEFFAGHGAQQPELTGDSLDKAAASPAEQKRRELAATNLLLANLHIEPVRNSSLIDISYKSRIPELSARIANTWPQEFIAATIDRQFASTAEARKYLEDRLADLRARLQQSESELINFGNEHQIVTLAASRDANGRTEAPRTLVASNLEALNSALNLARTERIAAESRARSKASNSSAEMLANGAITGLRTRREELAAEYAKFLVQFEPGYPPARAMKSQIDALDGALARETARMANSRISSYNEAARREAELMAQVQSVRSQFDQQQRDTIQYNIFQREVDTNRQLYDALLQRYKEIGVGTNVGATNIAIVDQAKVPGGPSSPNLALNLGIALLAGLLVSLGVVIGLEQIDEGIRNPDDVEKLIEVPLLGNVPLVSDGREEALTDPKSTISEAYQSTRTALAFVTDHGLPRSFVVTSSRAHEGKSMSCMALAIAICRTGRSVVLIDADMRSPSVHHMVGCGNARGLSNLLAGESDTPTTIVETQFNGLSAMPAGPTPPNSADLLSTDRMAELVKELQKRFDCVVINSPPVLGLADAPLLSGAVEGCVFVIQAERVPVRAIRGSLDRLRRVNGRIFGAIVTMVDYSQHRMGYGYGYGYGYDYQYGKSGSTG